MKSPTILVTGAAGKIGAAVTAQLRDRDVRVRALVRRQDVRSEALAELGAEVVVADLFDFPQVEAAMKGVTRVAYVPPWHPHVFNSAVGLAVAAQRAGVEAIVGVTQWLANPSHPALSTRQMWLIDRMFDQLAGIAHVTVAPGFFANNYLLTLPLASLFGVFPFPTGGGRNAPPSNEDIARVVVGALLDPERHAGRVYRPTGPELLSGDDMAHAMGEAVGRKVRHLDLPISMFMKAVRVQGPRLGIDDFFQGQFRWFLEETRLGTWEAGGVTSHVRDVAGVAPEDFPSIARRYAARPDAQRTLKNLVVAMREGLQIMLSTGIHVRRLEQRQQHPPPASPEYSGASSRWAAEHGVRLAAG